MIRKDYILPSFQLRHPDTSWCSTQAISVISRVFQEKVPYLRRTCVSTLALPSRILPRLAEASGIVVPSSPSRILLGFSLKLLVSDGFFWKTTLLHKSRSTMHCDGESGRVAFQAALDCSLSGVELALLLNSVRLPIFSADWSAICTVCLFPQIPKRISCALASRTPLSHKLQGAKQSIGAGT